MRQETAGAGGHPGSLSKADGARRVGFWPAVSRGLLTLVILQGATSLLPARNTAFNPRFSLTSTYTDNVRFIGQSAGTSDSDLVTSVRAMLPLDKRWEHSSLKFQYEVAADKYRDFGALDNVSHRLRLDHNVQLSRFSTLGVRAKYFLTQDQADPVILGDSADPDPFLTVRTQRRYGSLSMRYGRNLGARWEWYANGLVRRSDFEPIDNFLPGGGILQIPEDKTDTSVGTGFWRRFSKNTRLGTRYRFSLADLSMSGEVETHDFMFTFDSQMSKRFGVRGEAGGYYRIDQQTRESRSGSAIVLLLKFNDGVGLTAGPVRFDFGVGVSPSYGGALEGTSVNTAIFATMTGVRSRPVDWDFFARYGERKTDLFGQSDRDTVILGGSAEVGIRRLLAFRLSARHTTQDIPGQPSSSFYTVRAAFVWYPLGLTRIAAGK